MQLEIRGMGQATQSFVQLWGMYVSGFDPDKHCIYCLKSKKEARLHREMEDGDFDLLTDASYFYLSAMGRKAKHDTNVHPAVRPEPGAVASVGSVYGVTFTIRNAFALCIDRLPNGWMRLGNEFTSCRNSQFGVQQFGYRPNNGLAHPGDHSLIPKQADSCNL